ncbi:DALR anticodon-binding domain-containing protein [Streptomyces sp. H27-G5]|uniref:ArgS-related anticodon-binding protein NrtL n=1 Tax=Streptomyces sp. H27-G5 TaxID=2996698 RepID=UPI00226F7835|nr:DALR anticodon-binding domain-containing protein [Streptomyces sp. H27-G5]MCY0917310.1 DALR anticodon-binding domain-containing protein [Streptomyces sp. H27-G5]
MTPADLSRTVVRAVRCAVEDGELPVDAVVPERVVVERTRPGGVGEYATPVAFQVARAARRAPGEVAAVLARRLEVSDGIERVEITGAGFLNFVLRKRSVADLVREIHAQGIRYGCAPDSDQEQDQDQDHGQGLAVVPTPRTELRARVVRDVLLRIAATQTAEPAPSAPSSPNIAPVPAGEGDVVARFGVDAAAWAMLAVAPHESPVFAGRLLAQDESNEFFRVRYAHSRARALTRNAAQLGFGSLPEEFESSPREAVGEDTLLRVLGEHPLALEAAAHHRAPERLVRQLVELADALLDFQYRVLPQGDEKPSAAHRSRLALAEAAGTVLAGGLTLLGMDAPERL